MFDNIILNTDSYKGSHHLQYPPDTKTIFSYVESRGSTIPEINYTTFFGLQMFLKQYLEGVQVTTEKIDEAEAIWDAHGFEDIFNRSGWEYIRDTHGGKLPVSIRAVPEGSCVPVKNCLLTIENTDPACYWLTCFLETSLLRGVWYPTSVCTISNYARRLIYKSLVSTCEDPDGQIEFK